MADNTTLNSGAGGDVIASDDITGVKFQRVKLTLGSDGINGGDVAAANPMPISASSLPLPAGAATETTLAAINLKTFDSFLDASNSSSTPLAANATFTGAFLEAYKYSTLSVLVNASHPGTLIVEFSADAVTVHDSDTHTIPANIGKVYTHGTKARYLRVRYVNGATAQTAFTLQSIWHHGAIKNSSHTAGDIIAADDDGELVKAVITGLAPSGLFVNVKVTNAGNIKTSLEEIDASVVVPVSGPLTDAQLRASAVPVSLAALPTLAAGVNNIGDVDVLTLPALATGTNTIGAVTAPGAAALALDATLTGGTTKAIARGGAKGTAVAGDITSNPVDANTQALHVNLAGTNTVGLAAGTNNIGDVDVLTLPALVAGTAVIGSLVANQSVNKAQINGVVPLMGNGVTGTGSQRVTIASDNTAFAVNATPPTLTKGTQGATGYSTQDLKDAGRNPVHYYSVIPVLTSATDTLLSLTGTKAGATVVATTTPAVVTAAKTLRITRIAASYIAIATSGYVVVRLRFNTAGLVAITSPVATTMAVGAGTPATANSAGSEEAALSDGWEFAAGTGIGISAQGFAAATATAVGYVFVSVTGFEY